MTFAASGSGFGRWRTGGRLAPQAFLMFAVALVAAASAVALVLVYGAGARLISERERAQALAERDLLVEVAQEQGLASAGAAIARRARYSVTGERYGLFDPAGRALAGDIGAEHPRFVEADWARVRVGGPNPATLRVVATRLPAGDMLVVGRDLSGIHGFERAVLYGFVAALAIVAAAGFAAGLVLNALILQRVDAIAATAERIASGDLSARTPLSNRDDPFGRVGASLNAMLARIEELMTGMRTVTDSLAHDLRSPLTRMKGALARAMHRGATEEERLDAIETAHAEADRTLGTLSALLDIARAETGLSREMMTPVDLGALAAEIADFFAPLLEDGGQAPEFTPPPTPIRLLAHEALLRQAIGNLLHNAAQHAGEGASVRVTVDADANRARVIVADTGVGVAADQRGRVQERFVRLDPARTSAGSGLGLAIVAACAKLHGGGLQLQDNAPGLRAVLSLARTPSDEAPDAVRRGLAGW